MANALKTLYGALQSSTFITGNGVSLVFGDEETYNQRYGHPYIVMVPKGGPYVAPGYAGNLDPAIDAIWETAEQVDFWIFSSSSDPANQAAIDHTDAIETARQYLLSALRDQEAQYTDVNSVSYGLKTKVISGRWELVAQNSVSRLNRAYVLTTQIAISIPMATPQEATINSFSLSTTFVDKPSG